MAGRHGEWRRLRGGAGRPDLVKLGEKLLGYLTEQRRLSGVKTQEVSHRLPDGSAVRARWVYDQPIIEILVAPKVERPSSDPFLLEGFIVRPSTADEQAANTDHDHVLVRQTDWRPFFYDPDAVPEEFEPRHGFYGTLLGQPPVFENGLHFAGNLDWRNSDESVMVTFFGPENRYFPSGGTTFSSTVSFKSQLLLNLAEVELELTGYEDGVVRGACLRTVGGIGPCLFVVAEFQFSGGGLQRHECLLRFPVSPTDAAQEVLRRARTADWRLATELELGAGELLHEWNFPFTVNDDEHPWHFNQAGTEARCIRHDFDQTNSYEWILQINDGNNDEPASVTQLTFAYPTQTTVFDATFTAVPGVIPNDNFDYDTDGNPDYMRLFTNADTVLDSTRTTTVTPSATWHKVAVDYRDNEPVYAYVRLPEVLETVEFERTASGSVTVSSTASFPDPYIETTTTITQSATSATRNTIAVTGGLRTDWLEEIATTTETVETASSSSEDTVLEADYDGAGTTTYSGSGAMTEAAEQARTLHTQTYYVAYLDLRYEFSMTCIGKETRVDGFDASTDLPTMTTDQVRRFGGTGTPGGGPLLPSASPITGTINTRLPSRLAASDVILHALTESQVIYQDVPISSTIGNQFNTAPSNIVRGAAMFAGLFDDDALISRPATAATVNTAVASDNTPYDGTVHNVSVDTIDILPQNRGDFFIGFTSLGRTADYAANPAVERHGAYQIYKGKYCYSYALQAPSSSQLSTAVDWYHGVGNAVSGDEAASQLPELTGATEDEIRFHPVVVLTPTAVPT